MSKSIRYMTEDGFYKLVEDIKKAFPFLKTTRVNKNFIHLGVEGLDAVFINKSDKSITPVVLSYKVFYEKNTRTKCLSKEGFEQALTRKTLFKKLSNMEMLVKEYEEV